MKKEYDVVVLGSGPGGLTSAIYLGRYAHKTLVVSGNFGGVAAKAGDLENWPGTKKISGMQLMKNFREHAEEYDIDFSDKFAVGLKKMKTKFEVDLGDEKVKAKALIMSLGTKTRKLNIPGEDNLVGKGVSYCATCDGMFFKNKDVVVIGGADSACKAAIYLSKVAKKVRLVYRRGKLRGEPIYVKKIRDADNIDVIYNSSPVEIKGKNKVEGIVMKDKNEKHRTLKTDGVFIEIGAHPENRLAEMIGVKSDKNNYVKVGRDMKTNVDGVFAIGDMTNTPLRQVVTSAGDGAIAAFEAHEYLTKHH